MGGGTIFSVSEPEPFDRGSGDWQRAQRGLEPRAGVSRSCAQRDEQQRPRSRTPRLAPRKQLESLSVSVALFILRPSRDIVCGVTRHKTENDAPAALVCCVVRGVWCLSGTHMYDPVSTCMLSLWLCGACRCTQNVTEHTTDTWTDSGSVCPLDPNRVPMV